MWSEWKNEGCDIIEIGSSKMISQLTDPKLTTSDLYKKCNQVPITNLKDYVDEEIVCHNMGINGVWGIIKKKDSKCEPKLIGKWSKKEHFKNGTISYIREIESNHKHKERILDYIIKSEGLINGSIFNGEKIIKSEIKNGKTKTYLVITVEGKKCVPDWKCGEWEENGCFTNKSKKYSRQVNINYFDNKILDDLIKKNDLVVGKLFKSKKILEIIKEDRKNEGIWISVIVEYSNCMPIFKNDDWIDYGCQSNNTRIFARQINEFYLKSETAADQIINENKLTVGSLLMGRKIIKVNKKNKSSGMWIIVTVIDDFCMPKWKGIDWIDNGIQKDGTRKFKRQIDPQYLNSDKAANYLIKKDVLNKDYTFKGKKINNIVKELNKNEIWVNIYVDDVSIKTTQCIQKYKNKFAFYDEKLKQCWACPESNPVKTNESTTSYKACTAPLSNQCPSGTFFDNKTNECWKCTSEFPT